MQRAQTLQERDPAGLVGSSTPAQTRSRKSLPAFDQVSFPGEPLLPGLGHEAHVLQLVLVDLDLILLQALLEDGGEDELSVLVLQRRIGKAERFLVVRAVRAQEGHTANMS